MALIDQLHQAGIGVILDWVPSHFPTDPFALAQFDGTHLFEHADPRRGFHPDWNSLIFNYGRHEVRSFLASSAEHWLSRLPRRRPPGRRRGLDALPRLLPRARRVDPQRARGRENLEAVEFLRQLNTGHLRRPPRRAGHRRGVHRVARGLPPRRRRRARLRLKWDMGWMHDTLAVLRDATRSTGATTTASSPSGASTPSARTSCSPSPTTRWCTARVAAREDARRRLAEVRQPPPALRLPVRPAGQEAPVHGRRAGAVAGVGPRGAVSTGTSSRCPPTPGSAAGCATSTASTARSGPARRSTPNRPASSWTQPRRAPRPACSASCGGRRDGAAGAGGLQLHPRAAVEHRWSGSRAGALAGAAQQRRDGLRGQRRGQPRGWRRGPRATDRRGTAMTVRAHST